MNNSPKLSVRLMTYNHAPFILESLKSIESQQTKFNVEVLIGDDFSTDNTVHIIKEFISSSQNKNIDYILLDRKKGDAYDVERQKKGRLYNFVDIINHCKGKYIALLDGDDYWTDPLKLQKQVDFLEENKEFSFCFTRAQLLKNNKFELHQIPDIGSRGLYKFDDLLQHYNFIATATVLFRNHQLNFPDWIFKLPYGDMALYFLLAKNKVFKCLPDITTVYRIHDKGAWSGQNSIAKQEVKLLFLRVLSPHLTKAQKHIVAANYKSTVLKIGYKKYKKNRIKRVLYRMKLNIKFALCKR